MNDLESIYCIITCAGSTGPVKAVSYVFFFSPLLICIPFFYDTKDHVYIMVQPGELKLHVYNE